MEDIADTKIPFSCKVFRWHDWTVVEKETQPSVLDRIVGQVEGAGPWIARRPVVLTEKCRKCKKTRVKVINDV